MLLQTSDIKYTVNQKSSLIFQEYGTPYIEQINDTYTDGDLVYKQSKIIFIDANNIIERLKNQTTAFSIAETRFGNGLNFILTLQAYYHAHKATLEHDKNANNNSLTKLHFISVEKFPLTKKELMKSLALFPHLHDFYQSLIEQYPEVINIKQNNKINCSFLNNQVTLTLYIGDATEIYTQLPSPKEGLIDAWYLEHLVPNKSLNKLRTILFEQVARLAKEQSTLSTSSAEDAVKHKLTDVGFTLQAITPSGLENKVVKAIYQKNKTLGRAYQDRTKITKPRHISIIGGGISSACSAYFLTKQGVKVTLYCKDDEIAQGASSNAIGALFPLLHQQKDDISEFYEAAFWRAKALYNSLLAQGFNFSHEWCGLLDVSYKEALKKRQHLFESIKAWPNELIHSIDATQANTVSNININHGGLFMPEAGWIAPQELVNALFNAAQQTNLLSIKKNVHIESIAQEPDQTWILKAANKHYKENIVLVCGGADSIKINTINDLPLTSVRGQITSMATNENIGKLSTVVCHKGYLTPADKNIHCIGATFDKNSFDINANDEGNEYNLSMLNQCLPDLTQWNNKDVVTAKARLRCMTPDHIPIVGAMPNISAHKEVYAHLRKDKNWKFYESAPVIRNLYVLTGLGARGLCSAPLAAEILTAELCGTPYPVNSKMLFNLAPNRFVIRDLIKRKV